MSRMPDSDSSSIDKGELPSFEHPPVIETVLGAHFDAVPGMTNAHLGDFWGDLRSEYPHVDDAPRIEPAIEQFGEPQAWQPAGMLRISQDQSARLRARNMSRSRMIQVQSDRLHYNWLREGEEEYPRYANVSPPFFSAVKNFREYAKNTLDHEVHITQWEMTYVNHIDRNTVWSEPTDWASLFRVAFSTNPANSVKFESFGGHWHFEIEPHRGRLHVELRHQSIRTDGAPETLVMKLTARGPLTKGADQLSLLKDGLDIGHEAIVRSFTCFTSEDAHKKWGRTK